jgi:hypothetical protein
MSCLFRSLSSFILEIDATSLRRMITDYMETDPVLYDDQKLSDILRFEPGSPTLPRYIARMRLSSTWGGAIETKTFCNMFNAVVLVKVLRDGRTIEFRPSSDTSEPPHPFWISWNGSHYEPLPSPEAAT